MNAVDSSIGGCTGPSMPTKAIHCLLSFSFSFPPAYRFICESDVMLTPEMTLQSQYRSEWLQDWSDGTDTWHSETRALDSNIVDRQKPVLFETYTMMQVYMRTRV